MWQNKFSKKKLIKCMLNQQNEINIDLLNFIQF